MRILKVSPQPDYTLIVNCDNGRSGSFDVTPYLKLEAFQPLKDIAEFSQVINGGYYVEWPCGADLSADTIEAHLKMTKIATG